MLTLACAMSALVPLPTLLRPSRHHELQIRAIAGQQVRVRLRRPLGIVFEEADSAGVLKYLPCTLLLAKKST